MNENSLIDKIQASFSTQAGNFENRAMNFSKQEYLDYTVKTIDLQKTDHVLEVLSKPFLKFNASSILVAHGKEQFRHHQLHHFGSLAASNPEPFSRHKKSRKPL